MPKGRLTYTERQILHCLARSWRPVPIDRILEEVWNINSDPESPITIRTHICNIRKKIAFTGLYITCTPGIGYVLKC